MSEQQANLGKLWVSFVKKSIDRSGGFSVPVAYVAVGFAWLGLLGTTTSVRLSVKVLALFAAMAVLAAIVSIANRKGWPCQAMFAWAIRERTRLYEGPNEVPEDEELATRVSNMIFGPSRESWAEVRSVAAQLKPAVRREHIMATADLFETRRFDRAAFDDALTELPSDAERRYWRVRLAMTEAFAAFAYDEECLPILLEAASREGPFVQPLIGRLRVWLYRFSTVASLLVVGVVAAVVILVALGA